MRNLLMIGLFLVFSTFRAYAQLECAPNTDYCFPQKEPGHIVVVPSNQYPTIQFAIDQAPEGTVIRIKGGEYFENIVVSKNVKFHGNNPPGRPTIIHGASSSDAIFTLSGSPLVEFKNLKLKDGLAGVMTDIQTQDNAKVVARNMVIEDVGRGIMGTYESIELTKTEISRPEVNGLSLSGVGSLKLKDVSLRFAKGYGMVIIGSSGSAVFASYVTVEGNEKGGIYASNVTDGLTLNHIVASNNFGAGIIIDHTPRANVQRSEIYNNKLIGENFGNGILVYSSEVLVSQTNFKDNEGFDAALVGCGIPNEEYDVSFSKSTFKNSFDPSFTTYALYLTAGCESSPGGTLQDLGGNSCEGSEGPTVCKGAPTGDLAPVSPEL